MTFYGQHGEDIYLKSLFKDTLRGVCIEVGAYDGISMSNTFHFEKLGWRCLCIEPVESSFINCKKNRADALQYCISDADKADQELTVFALNTNLSAITSLQPDQRLIESHKHLITDVIKQTVKVRSLTSILNELNFPTDIDFISVDTENTELDVLKGIDFKKYNIKVFVVENNYNEPFCEEYLKNFGYVKIHRIAVNDFYIRAKFYGEVQNEKHVDETIRQYFPDYTYKGVFFDIGAYEPINISNSYHFEKSGWDVYCFEANTLLIKDLKEKRKNVFNYAIYDTDKDVISFNVVRAGYGGGSGMAGLSAVDLSPQYIDKFGIGKEPIIKIDVPQKTLNTILETELSHIRKIDVISVDVEGGELNVLKGLDLEKYTPSLIVAENVFNNMDIFNYLKEHGYSLHQHIDYNQYYVRNSYFST